ncbi:MAG: hypothetical protein EA418_10330 [Wenzhouxiangellaceae bacterium]|nr:MAG: hypothetical protein EA418_10330 [Wenzhouxiangellaceae bacterium]
MHATLEQLDLKHLFHPNTDLAGHAMAGPLIWERGEGVWMYNTHGRRTLEGMGGLWFTALGCGERESEFVERLGQELERVIERSAGEIGLVGGLELVADKDTVPDA